MTATLEAWYDNPGTRVANAFTSLRFRAGMWAYQHGASLLIVTALLAVCGTVRVVELSSGSPGAWNDDEGTYVSQAWAMLFKHQFAHYTYWYDHPFFGWAQIAVWAGLTDGFARNSIAVMVGRELTTIYALVGGVLIYALSRKLGLNRVFSGLAMALLMLCPIAQSYGTMVYLDSLGVPWVLLALLLASYCDRNTLFAIGSGLALMMAGLTKETMLAFTPAVLFMVWQTLPKYAKFRFTGFAGIAAVLLGLVYIGVAILKGELFPGKGHVSLIGSLGWQLGGRGSSGFFLDPSSLSGQWFGRWMSLDPWLLMFSVPMLVVICFRRKLWPIALAAIVHLALLARPGYLPIPFVIILIPIAALVVAGGLDTIWKAFSARKWLSIGSRSLAVVLTVAMLAIITPAWAQKTIGNMNDHSITMEADAVAWIVKNVPASEHKQILVDDNVWPDLILRGYDRKNVDWLYKVDADPAISPYYIRKGGSKADMWKAVDYVVIPPLDDSVIKSVPTLYQALKHSTVVARFEVPTPGSYDIYKVNH